MTTITYTYDETKCTNKDYMILELTESVDDGGAGYESLAKYHIDCPYTHSCDCLNDHEGNKYDTEEYEQGCVRCKLAWLDRKYDTYPSEDGKWKTEE